MTNFTKIAKERGAQKVELTLERHPVVDNHQPTGYKITKIIAYRTESKDKLLYFWNTSTMGVRGKFDSEFIYTKRARFLIMKEKEV